MCLHTDKDDKKLGKALSDLSAAKAQIAELKAQNDFLKGKLELAEQMLAQEQSTKAVQIELAASKAMLQAQQDLTQRLNDAYNNGLKFAQSAYATFAAPRGPPSSGHRSCSSRYSASSHSSNEEY